MKYFIIMSVVLYNRNKRIINISILLPNYCTATGSRDGAVVRALASNQCGPGSIPGPGVICGLSLLLVLVPAPRVFLRVLRFSSLHNNQHFQIPIRSGIRGPQVCQSRDFYVLPSLNIVDLFILAILQHTTALDVKSHDTYLYEDEAATSPEIKPLSGKVDPRRPCSQHRFKLLDLE